MSEIIKSGLFVEGLEVTSEHIGQELNIGENFKDLSTDYKCIITEIDSDDCPIRVENREEGVYIDHEWLDIEEQGKILHWKWVDRSLVEPQKPKQSSTKPTRQKLAKAIKQSVADLQKLIDEADSYGMIVEGISIEDIKVKFYPPMEEY